MTGLFSTSQKHIYRTLHTVLTVQFRYPRIIYEKLVTFWLYVLEYVYENYAKIAGRQLIMARQSRVCSLCPLSGSAHLLMPRVSAPAPASQSSAPGVCSWRRREARAGIKQNNDLLLPVTQSPAPQSNGRGTLLRGQCDRHPLPPVVCGL